MKNLVKVIKGSLYKNIHSMLMWIHIAVPVITVLFMSWYLDYVSSTTQDRIASFAGIIGLGFTFIIGIVVAIFFEQENKASKFQNILSLPYSRITIHCGNLIALMVMGFIACVSAFVGFGVANFVKGNNDVGMGVYAVVGSMIFVTTIGQYILNYVICLIFGKGISIGFGVVGFIISATMAYGNWDTVWKFFPCAYGYRTSSYIVCNAMREYIVNADMYIKNVFANMEDNISMMTIVTVLIILVFCVWSKIWEGSKCAEE